MFRYRSEYNLTEISELQSKSDIVPLYIYGHPHTTPMKALGTEIPFVISKGISNKMPLPLGAMHQHPSQYKCTVKHQN
jgi:hypothetical protein